MSPIQGQMDTKILELEGENCKLRNDVKQLTDDNKLMWDLWKQVQASKPDMTQIIAITAAREAKKFAAKEQHIWTIVQERESDVKRLQEELSGKDAEMRSLLVRLSNCKDEESLLRSKCDEFAVIENKLRDEIDRLNKQLIDSDDVNNRLLVSMEKECCDLKAEVECLKQELSVSDQTISKLRNNFDAANSSSSNLLSELTSYRQMVTILESEVSGLKTNCRELQRSLDDKCAELNSVNASNEDLTMKIDRQTRILRELEYQIESLEARNKQLTAQVDGCSSELAAVPYSCDGASIVCCDAQSQIVELKDHIVKLTAAYEAKSQENEILRCRSDGRFDAVERLHSEQRAIQSDLAGLDKKLRKENKKFGDYSANLINELESSLETEKLIAMLKQHCRELANDRDAYANQLEKAMLQLANQESLIADMRVKMGCLKRDREADVRKVTSDYERRLNEALKHQSTKATSELSRIQSENAVLTKKLENSISEKRRLRSQLSACQARLSREGAVLARQHDRIIELEQNVLTKSAKLQAATNKAAERSKTDVSDTFITRRRRTRSASYCPPDDSPPRLRQKLLTFDMATQTEDSYPSSETAERPFSSTTSVSTLKAIRRNTGNAIRQQLTVEKMRVARLLRLAANLKADRMKLNSALDEERQTARRLEQALVTTKSQFTSSSVSSKLMENKIAALEAEVACLRKALIDAEQRAAELCAISPRVDKSVITDQFESSCPPSPKMHITMEIYEEAKQRIASLLTTEREQAARLGHYQAECDRLEADLALAKERLNEARREQSKDRRLCEEQREKIRVLEHQASNDAIRMKDLTEKLVRSEKNDKNVATRITALKRRIEECESDRSAFQKRLDEERCANEKLAEQLKKAKTRCQYLEVMANAEKGKLAHVEVEFKESVKKLQYQLGIRNAQIDEFKRFLETYVDMVVDQMRSDRRFVKECEVSSGHNKSQQMSSPSKRAMSQVSNDASLISRAASFAQAHLMLSAEEAAELLMTRSVDASPPPSSAAFDLPESLGQKLSNIIRQIFVGSGSKDFEDSTQFANRLSHALFSGYTEHVRFLIHRPQCCLKTLSKRQEKSRLYGERHATDHRATNSSTIAGFSDSVFSGSPYC